MKCAQLFIVKSLADINSALIVRQIYRHSNLDFNTVHRPGDDPRKECDECGNARGSNVRYYPT
jgi:hypothetical protein